MTKYSAALYNLEEYAECNNKSLDISRYLADGSKAYSQCFLWLHTGSRPVNITYSTNVLLQNNELILMFLRKKYANTFKCKFLTIFR